METRKENPLHNVGALLLGLYLLGMGPATVYYNWAYARRNGVAKWFLYLKQVYHSIVGVVRGREHTQAAWINTVEWCVHKLHKHFR